MPIRQVIFDLDGVLADSRPLHKTALNMALASFGEKYVISDEEHAAKYDGRPTSVKLRMLTEEKGLPSEDHQEIWRLKQEKTLDAIRECIRPNPTHIAMFHALKQRGYRLVCCSNSIRLTLDAFLQALGISELLDASYSNEDVVQPKPHPAIYLRAVLESGILPKETVICEDSPIGRRAALDSGCHLCPVEEPASLTIEYLEKTIAHLDAHPITSIIPWMGTPDMHVVIPMAGAGSRFAKEGYTDAKPMIDVGGFPMIQLVVRNLAVRAHWIFVVQKEHSARYNFKRLLPILVNEFATRVDVIEVEKLTEGAACTTLLAKDLINDNQPVFIANCDQFLEWDSSNFFYRMQAPGIDGGMVTFHRENDPKWSYASVDKDGFVTQVVEKVPISNIATVGFYYWRRGSDYVAHAEEMIQKNIRVNNEFYVAPIYNTGIAKGMKFITHHCREFWGIGVPADLQYFLEHYKGPL